MNRCPQNTDATLQVAQEFLDELCQSWLDCPSGVRRVLRILGEEVARRWPHMVQSSVCNLLILRLLSPAIMASAASTSPHLHHCIIAEPSPTSLHHTTTALDGNAKRTLLLVTKMLQSLANGVALDGSKEDYMKQFGAFSSRANQQRLSSFVDQLTVRDAPQPDGCGCTATNRVLVTSRTRISCNSVRNWELSTRLILR